MDTSIEKKINEILRSRGLIAIDFSRMPKNIREAIEEAYTSGSEEGWDEGYNVGWDTANESE